ncbi:3-oxoacyl-[acyl-carrier-protein] synthase II [Streptoalloteichus tenebrarius]|uniref:3-oxoacyl-[acyl-carrier-protein] synthase 2 n=1 Tax=Streptoalloteichus tenebrarius (strain ATCC 17920 / DSM 40477 / JCM 4838 / CBS 697.72 / NBRC 16177 / NCIMB 11028 / NRRL B-12390 / A12253. 1 / ISP 5477) TaxID=1933 RepID=A0ABT1HMF2_STRSD|nr:beta-ketoacyl-ACP synthase II [Streptoalloteichus tenebrarius]MCP2256694.1 3-oxoacyl-[acyl-carrier-protein] synthase II [Streptoalloteichus tenebrarius]BFF00406.1 beta-ketoacyl-[acyl-carrier-protein] synthase family protein [Streptoalloteichus tenebrarius]
MSTENDVVVTGLGATTPLGGDVTSTWQALLDGRSGVGLLDADWLDKFELPVRIAAQLAVEPTEVLARVEARRMDRCEQVAMVAARQAWADAGLAGDEPQVEPERLAVVVGTGIGGAMTMLQQDDLLETVGLRKVSPLTVPMLMPNGPAAWVGLDLGSRGGVHAPVSACASGAEALAWAWRMLRAGEVDVVVAGGAEACITALPLAGFAQARTMSTRNDEPEKASRPFDAARDGFVLGEGAGIMVLERAEFAKARGARIHGRLAGVGTSADAYHITGPEPEGKGAARAITAALRTAGLTPQDVGHVNAHATSTPVGDVAEAAAIRSAVGDHPVVTAPKSALGHLLGAAGAVEAIATLLAVRDGVVPPTLNLDNLDPAVQLDVVAGEARRVELTAAVNDSFGFGGHNVALAFTPA